METTGLLFVNQDIYKVRKNQKVSVTNCKVAQNLVTQFRPPPPLIVDVITAWPLATKENPSQ